jgi:hypothetical protein
VEALAQRSAADFDAFYEGRQRPAGDPGDVVVLSCDGKGIIMRHETLRPVTAEAATNASNKLPTRLSRGEKRNRERMSDVGVVYESPLPPAARPTSCPAPTTSPWGRHPAPLRKPSG